jgi:hypothetical protein
MSRPQFSGRNFVVTENDPLARVVARRAAARGVRRGRTARLASKAVPRVDVDRITAVIRMLRPVDRTALIMPIVRQMKREWSG